MIVKVSKDYTIWEDIRKNDLTLLRKYESVTSPLEYHRWQEIDATWEEIQEMAANGDAIMINC